MSRRKDHLSMNTSVRHARISELVDEQGAIAVPTLASLLDTSEATIRRDLVKLDELGLLRRTHGGARRVSLRGAEPAFYMRRAVAAEAKERMAEVAVGLIGDGEAVILDSGTSCYEVAKRLGSKEAMVMPLSLRALHALAAFPAVTLSVCAGSVRPQEQSLVGPLAVETIDRFRFDTAIISGCGFSLEGGLTAYDVDDAAVKSAAIRNASRVILLCDDTKWGEHTFAWTAPTKSLSTIITDHRMTPAEGRIAADLGVEVLSI